MNRWSKRWPSRALVVLVSMIVTASPVAATNYGGATYSPYRIAPVERWTTSWRTTNDSIRAQIYPLWDQTHRNGVQNYVAQGYRYTQEVRDLSGNLNATGRYVTTFPNPVYDRDNDYTYDWRFEEAEITANYAPFPSANGQYRNGLEFSHWFSNCSPRTSCYWDWDADGGTVGHLSQISSYSSGTGEWNAVYYTWPAYAQTSYPPLARPVSASLAETEFAASADVDSSEDHLHATSETRAEGTRRVVVEGVAATVEPDGSELDIRVEQPGAAWKSYRDRHAHHAAAVIRSPGPYQVIVTFAEPLNEAQFADIASMRGVEVTSFEAIGTASDGLTLTIGGVGELPIDLRAAFDAEDADAIGIVSASVTVENAGAYERLARRPDVLLADVTGEYLKRSVATDRGIVFGLDGTLDVIVNDIYWEYAGLSQ